MPRRTREYLQRYADQAINDMERSIEKITQLRDTYIDGTETTDEIKVKMKSDITCEPVGAYVQQIQAWNSLLQILTQARDFAANMRQHYV